MTSSAEWRTMSKNDKLLGTICFYCGKGILADQRYYHYGNVLAHARCQGAETLRKYQEWLKTSKLPFSD